MGEFKVIMLAKSNSMKKNNSRKLTTNIGSTPFDARASEKYESLKHIRNNSIQDEDFDLFFTAYENHCKAQQMSLSPHKSSDASSYFGTCCSDPSKARQSKGDC